MVDDFVAEFVMPAAPTAARTDSDASSEEKSFQDCFFALFSFSALGVVCSEFSFPGVLMTYDPELSERHEEFKQLSGFDNVTTSGAWSGCMHC